MILSFRIFRKLSIPNRKSWGADILREYSRPTICHMSRVTLSHYLFFDKVIELVGGGSGINGAYPIKFYTYRPYFVPKSVWNRRMSSTGQTFPSPPPPQAAPLLPAPWRHYRESEQGGGLGPSGRGKLLALFLFPKLSHVQENREAKVANALKATLTRS